MAVRTGANSSPRLHGAGELPKYLESVLVLTTSARPNEGLVLDTLKTKVVEVVTIPIDFTQSHRFATVIPGVDGVWGGYAHVERGGEGR